jgi:hypothetical protein
VLDQVVHLVLVLVVKGGYPNDHLVYQDAEGPPVGREVMARADNHFRGEVLWSPTKRIRLARGVGCDFCESEVSKHDVAVSVNQDIFRFQIPINNFAVM